MKSGLHPKDSQEVDGWEHYYQSMAGDDAWSAEPDPFREEISKILKDEVVLCVVDLACGDGRNTVPWLREDRFVVAIDSSPTALELLRQRCRKEGLPLPLLLQGDMRRTSLFDKQANVVQCIDALSQVEEPAVAIRDMTRILTPGGWLAFNIFTPNDCAFGEGTLVSRNRFVYRDTNFSFFEPEEVRELIPGDLDLVDFSVRRWEDPPHLPFRPYRHTHEAAYCLCRRRT